MTSPHTDTGLDIVIFGGAGDLSFRKLLPALYMAHAHDKLSDDTRIVAVGRQAWDTVAYLKFIDEKSPGFIETSSFDHVIWQSFLNRLVYVSVDVTAAPAYAALKSVCDTARLRVFYLATAPSLFSQICAHLHSAGLVDAQARVVLEKPLGTDLASARAINQDVAQYFNEQQIYRIDHYLGKETVQNLMVLRFGNAIFEPLWRAPCIKSVQITVAETVGVGSRAGFYDGAGAMRDMVPNHLFQLLALTAMEPPASLSANAVRTEKTKVLTSVHPMNAAIDSVRGQYGAGERAGQALKAYRDEEGVAPASKTETFVAMKLTIDNWRWAGVPFYLRTGKSMAMRNSEILIQFKRPPLSLFKDTATEDLTPNSLLLKLQPDEGAALSFGAKIPGPAIHIGQVHMDFHYKDYFQNAPSTGYETLIYDCMIGDATLFQRSDAVIAGWEIVQPLLDYWADGDKAPLVSYPAGSDGPQEADDLFGHEHRAWKKLV